MSDYSKATNFTAKDSLPSGNSNKIVKGSEIDNEFIAISSAIASKADINSPTLTGTPAAPTATAGSNTTQIANTAFVKAAFDTLGTMSTQSANAVAITGGSITGVTVSSLATDVTVADGGTGASTFTQNSVVLGNGTAPLNGNMVAPGTVGNVLTSNGTTWISGATGGTRGQVFTSSGTFTVPTGVTTLKVIVVGGGGGAALLGGVGGAGGNASGGAINVAGRPGQGTGEDPIVGFFGGASGGTIPAFSYGLGGSYGSLSTGNFSPIGFGGGAINGEPGTVSGAGSAGGGGGVAVGFLTGLTPGANISVTIGAGGTNPSLNNANAGGTSSFATLTANGGAPSLSGGGAGVPNNSRVGGAGVVIVEW
jgi:hypothetical protein